MSRNYLVLSTALSALLSPLAAQAEDISMVLNWVPTADHAPYFYAKQQGWYEAEGIDLEIEAGRGSGAAVQRVAAGIAEIGVADLATVLLARGEGANATAVMTVYANTPQGFYWLKSSGIETPKDFSGRSIGNPPADASRIMWPLFAKTVGIEPDSVKFVNVSPQAKLASLKSGAIDVTSDFYNEHDLKVREFGDDLGFVAWRDIGVNPYGNSIIVNETFLAEHRDTVGKFAAVSQKAFAACVADFQPCLDALMSDVSGLDAENQKNQWSRIKELMRDETTQTVALGAFSPERMAADYSMVETYFDLKEPFDIETVYTNDFLDETIKMTAE
ncbi:ABC transporter substrate-binding protein [Falsihalocynthiibacter arcticus]|uniref:Nitrate ABC transporter substrate-binding protein n=1 Tax=Falsihalocynthiibacter arcticus TaxID=1579316 RepID=A0A126V282_9RHOB|nr:ABC transporter substrate-binding protein [Falsihalocynthiibacter arcticus]AML51789.1 nitrate ABC transporter substrate-binding protein [Falsihalocynthiibacter arcticus]